MLCKNNGITLELLRAVLCKHADAANLVSRADNIGWTVFHFARSAVAHVTDYGTTPLHRLCCNANITAELVLVLLEFHPEATQQADRHGRMPLHMLCQNTSIELSMLAPILAAYPEATRKESVELNLPSHFLCKNTSLTFDLVVPLLGEYAQAINKADKYGMTPLHNLNVNPVVSKEERPRYEAAMREA